MFWLAFQTPTKPRRSERTTTKAVNETESSSPAEEMPGIPGDHDRNRLIRERAYQIWLDEGRPHGREQDHWRQAEIEIAAETQSAG
jgi:hypothetical protein